MTAVRVIDRGANEILRLLGESHPMTVKVGILAGEGAATTEDGTTTVVEVAEQHEFGIGVPRRSFIADYVDENAPLLESRLRAIADAVVRRRLPIKPGLEQFGLVAQSEIQERMANSPGDWPPLSQAYADEKHGGDVTPRLILTGQLRSSVTYEVIEGLSADSGGDTSSGGGTP